MKSQIIVDFLNKKITVKELLFRLKVITNVLKNTEIKNWINSEINGYKNESDVPAYRKIILEPKFSAVNSGWKMENIAAPLFHLKEDERKQICDYLLKESIGVIEKSILKSEPLYMEYNEAVRFLISKAYDQEINVYSVHSQIPLPFAEEVLANVENRLLDIFLELESEFGNLDKYDVLDKLDERKLNEVSKIILNYINIGDNNNIGSSMMGVKYNDEENN